jgi:uncharacterized membrane protein
MKKSRTIWLTLLAIAAWIFFQPAQRTARTVRIKVENDDAILSGMSGAPAATAYGYDPYFTDVNNVSHISIHIAKTAVETR